MPIPDCERCRKPANPSTCSMFNTETICMDCKDRERAHPDYARAAAAEGQAVLNGEMNFPGIGLPPDLRGSRQ